MENELEILKEKYGTWEAVAGKLHVTLRHLYNVRNGEHIGDALAELIRIYARRIKELE